jgi:uncharacterized membrane protein
MTSKAAITVHRSRDEVQRLWSSSEYGPAFIGATEAAVTFKDAPGDRGTEIHVELGSAGNPVTSLLRGAPLAKVKDDLRRFKQHVETGEIPRSDGVPEGELAERKLKQRPAQPLEESELEKAGVR